MHRRGLISARPEAGLVENIKLVSQKQNTLHANFIYQNTPATDWPNKTPSVLESALGNMVSMMVSGRTCVPKDMGAVELYPVIPMEWGLRDGTKTATQREGQRADIQRTCEHKNAPSVV